ncbi:MAG: flotillin-like protein FloA [Planctomycetes bacterium]|nr:flotillin-like protein FloA [Planctomycetota bacterium]
MVAAAGWVWAIVAIIALVAFVFLAIVARFFKLWVQALFAHANITFGELIGMALRKVDPRVIVLSKIRAVQAGLDVSTRDLESHYLAGGRVPNVITALIAANRANIDLSFKTATAIDLAGRDILDAVQTSVNPKVIDCPNPASGKTTVDAVAKDGIQVKAKARVTVRANIDRLVGGATEETIIARVGEGIVTTIGSANSYKEVLENPDLISKQVLEKGLDAGTAFEILSIDIADVDVGENVGAKLQADQAEADKRRFQAEAERRRAMALAREQEMRAATQENRAKVVLAEAEIPRAIAEAFRAGHLGIMDYYRLRNIQADTQMRENIGGGGTTASGHTGDTGRGPEPSKGVK